MTLDEATQSGIIRLRLPAWHPGDYIELNISNGKRGPWVRLYSPVNEVIGRPNPQVILMVGDRSSEYVEYVASDDASL